MSKMITTQTVPPSAASRAPTTTVARARNRGVLRVAFELALAGALVLCVGCGKHKTHADVLKVRIALIEDTLQVLRTVQDASSFKTASPRLHVLATRMEDNKALFE